MDSLLARFVIDCRRAGSPEQSDRALALTCILSSPEWRREEIGSAALQLVAAVRALTRAAYVAPPALSARIGEQIAAIGLLIDEAAIAPVAQAQAPEDLHYNPGVAK